MVDPTSQISLLIMYASETGNCE